MKHPQITQWADYARSLVDEAERAALDSHLAEGCGLCRSTLEALELVAATASAETELTPSEGVIRSVKAFFATQHPQAPSAWRELVLRPAFDSALAPAAAASRNPASRSRQLLFESDRYTLELSLDTAPGTVDAVLRGQILGAHGRPSSHAPVFLVGDGEVIGRAISEQHGTFELSGRMDRTCELWVFPDEQSRIRLSLEPEH